MLSIIFWICVGIVLKTLIPMPYIDVFIRNIYAKLLGYEQEFIAKTPTPTPTPTYTSTTTIVK